MPPDPHKKAKKLSSPPRCSENFFGSGTAPLAQKPNYFADIQMSVSGPKDIRIDGDDTEELNENETDETENRRSLRKKRKERLLTFHKEDQRNETVFIKCKDFRALCKVDWPSHCLLVKSRTGESSRLAHSI